MEEGIHYCVLNSFLSVCVWQSIAPEGEHMGVLKYQFTCLLLHGENEVM